MNDAAIDYGRELLAREKPAMTYLLYFPAMREVARGHGYALAIHGSLNRDFDLVAVPWTPDASDAETLVDAICADNALVIAVRDQGDKPHGRRCWTLKGVSGVPHGWVDFSVMPLQPAPARLRATPPAAVGNGTAHYARVGDAPLGTAGTLTTTRQDGDPLVWICAACNRSGFVGGEVCTTCYGHGVTHPPTPAPAGGDVAASQPAPSSAQVGSSGGDVAAAVGGEAVAALMEQHRSWCEMYGGFGASSPWSRDVGLLLTALTTERAAHEAAVRAVEAERQKLATEIGACRALADLWREEAAMAKRDRDTERARAEALGAALLRYGVHANDCTSRLRGPDSCDCGWPETRKKCEAATRAAESAGGGE